MTATEMIGTSATQEGSPLFKHSPQTVSSVGVSLEQKYEALRWELVEYKQQAHYWEALYKNYKQNKPR